MKLFSKKDVILIFFILLIALCAWLFTKNSTVGGIYEISIDSAIVCRESIYKKKTTRLNNGVVIVCDGKSVYFEHSGCPDLVCVGMGRLSFVGEWAACLPNNTYLEVVE